MKNKYAFLIIVSLHFEKVILNNIFQLNFPMYNLCLFTIKNVKFVWGC